MPENGNQTKTPGKEKKEGNEEEGDNAEDERLLFGEKREETTLFVGNDLGVTKIDVAASQIGQYSLLERCTVRCLATDGKYLVVASDEGVLLTTGEEFLALGFEAATAVGIDDTWLYAACENRVARLDRDGIDVNAEITAGEWETVGEVSEPRRFEGSLLATADGIVRVDASVETLGLADAKDIAADGTLAATAAGLYRREDGDWTQVLAGDASAVIESGSSAYAIVDGALFERDGNGWTERTVPGDSPPVDLAYGKELAVITEDGTVHVEADPERTHDGHGGWRSQALGLRDVTGFVALGG